MCANTVNDQNRSVLNYTTATITILLRTRTRPAATTTANNTESESRVPCFELMSRFETRFAFKRNSTGKFEDEALAGLDAEHVRYCKYDGL